MILIGTPELDSFEIGTAQQLTRVSSKISSFNFYIVYLLFGYFVLLHKCFLLDFFSGYIFVIFVILNNLT